MSDLERHFNQLFDAHCLSTKEMQSEPSLMLVYHPYIGQAPKSEVSPMTCMLNE